MSYFHKVKIKDIRRETDHCVSIAFDIPESLEDEFKYIQGQYITLRMNIDGKEVRRSYSVCSSPICDADMRIAVKAVENGKVSPYLNNGIQVGNELEVMKPMGNFYVNMPEDKKLHLVGFAAGSGITPVLSLLKTALSVNDTNSFTLFYGNKSVNDIIFKQELHALVEKYQDRLQVHHILSREKADDPLFEGRISPEKTVELLKKFEETAKADAFFLCGPFDMTMGIKDSLIEFGVDKERIHFELFTTVEKETSDDGDAESDGKTRMPAAVTIILDGDETELEITGNETVLDAALDADLDAPYACTGGSCCTCRAKLLEGSVEMDVNYALTDEEVEEGYILTCQSHPTSPKIVVDYDAP